MYKEQLENQYKQINPNEFSLESYLYQKTGQQRIEDEISKDSMHRFMQLCESIKSYFHNDWEEEGLSEIILERQKNAILGREKEVNFFKDKISEYIKINNLGLSWYPRWYKGLTDAIFQENWGIAGLSQWKEDVQYKNSSSAKIIGNRIYYFLKGKQVLMPQTIQEERKRLLIDALLLNEKNRRFNDDYAEIYMVDGTRITIFGNKKTKEGQTAIVFRKYIIPQLTFEEQGNRGTIPREAIPMFHEMIKIGYNIAFLGAVRTAKTTFLQTWQMYEDDSLEGVVVETDPEIPMHLIKPNAPIIQLVADGDELKKIIKNLMRSDADYIIMAEARDGVALDIAVKVANKGTRRVKITFHTSDPVDFCYDVAEEIVKIYGGSLKSTIRKTAKSFQYLFYFVQLPNQKEIKKLKAIYEVRYDSVANTIQIHLICRYDYSGDTWQFNNTIGKDKEVIGEEENREALLNFKKELKRLSELYPMSKEITSLYEPAYYNGTED